MLNVTFHLGKQGFKIMKQKQKLGVACHTKFERTFLECNSSLLWYFLRNQIQNGQCFSKAN